MQNTLSQLRVFGDNEYNGDSRYQVYNVQGRQDLDALLTEVGFYYVVVFIAGLVLALSFTGA